MYQDMDSICVIYSLDKRVTSSHGLPAACMLRIMPREDSVEFDFSWHKKPANRAPEALWLSFNPNMKLRGVYKLGYIINPANVLPKGGKGMHATGGKVIFDDIVVEAMDSMLISVGRKNVYNYETGTPDMMSGIFFNLFNNQWGTNFPMWNEGDSRFRFILSSLKME